MKPNTVLKTERELRGWSQARVAEEMGTTSLNVGRWERGVSLPYPHFREKLCRLFGKDARELGLLEADDDASASGQAETTSPGQIGHAIDDPAIPLPSTHEAHLIGRDPLLQHLRAGLCAGRERPVTLALHGLPGVGKTALAIELAYDPEIRAHFSDGILWIGQGLQPDISEQLSRWGTLLGVAQAVATRLTSPEEWARAIRMAIGQRRLLLVIDDAWDLSAALAFQIGGPACAYLYTTRFPSLAVQLAGPGARPVPELAEEDGVTLLARYAAEFVHQAPGIAQGLVRSVGALPLALTLIGKYLSVQVYNGQPRRLYAAVEHLRDARARLMLTEIRSPADRHPSLSSGTPLSLQSIIAVSEQLLSPQASAALRCLSLFPARPNSFSEEAALAICQTSPDILDSLCDAGLLESNGPSRYMLHQTISDYASHHLRDLSSIDRLIEYYVSFLETHVKDFHLLELETSNILTALDLAHRSQRRSELIRCMHALADFLLLRGLYSLSEKHMLRAHEAACDLGDDGQLILILIHLSALYRDWGKLDQAEAYAHKGLHLARHLDDRGRICTLLSILGKVADLRGNNNEAEAFYREGLTLTRELDQGLQTAQLLNGLAVQAGKRGQYEQADAYMHEGLALARRIQNGEREVAFLVNLGTSALFRGQYERASAFLQEGLAVAHSAKYGINQGAALVRLGDLNQKRGNFELSHAYLSEAFNILHQIGDTNVWLPEALLSEGKLAIAEGDDELAEQIFDEAIELTRTAGLNDGLIEHGSALAHIAIRRGEFARARALLEEIQPLADQSGVQETQILVSLAWGELHLHHGSLLNALHQFAHTRHLASPEQREFLALSLFGEARASLAMHDHETARERGEKAARILREIGHFRAREVEEWLGSAQ